jgi:hypothetical protein
MMSRAEKGWVLALVAALGVWGCARGPSSQAGRLSALEARCAKLEKESRGLVEDLDRARRKMAALEEDNDRLKKDLECHKVVLRERDALKKEVASRTGERDLLQARCDRLKKGLQSLLGEDEAVAHPAATPVTAASTGPELDRPNLLQRPDTNR